MDCKKIIGKPYYQNSASAFVKVRFRRFFLTWCARESVVCHCCHRTRNFPNGNFVVISFAAIHKTSTALRLIHSAVYCDETYDYCHRENKIIIVIKRGYRSIFITCRPIEKSSSSLHITQYQTMHLNPKQVRIAVASIARDDPSTLPGDDPFPHARMHRDRNAR